MSGLMFAQRRIILTPKNPNDICTVVSIYPKDIYEVKHTLYPGEFHIPKGTVDNPSILEVGASSWFRFINDDEPMLEIPVSSIIMAESIVKDWRNGIHLNGPQANPGLIFFNGKVNLKQLLNDPDKRPLFDTLIQQQKTWFKALVKDADVLWARSNGNPIVISDDARYAAERLELKEKSWMQDFSTLEMSNCPACGTLRNPNFPICSNCKTVVDVEKWKKLNLVQS